MSPDTKKRFFQNRTEIIKIACLMAMLAIPFGLYFAASAGTGFLIYLFLGLMGLVMVLAMKWG